MTLPTLHSLLLTSPVAMASGPPPFVMYFRCTSCNECFFGEADFYVHSRDVHCKVLISQGQNPDPDSTAAAGTGISLRGGRTYGRTDAAAFESTTVAAGGLVDDAWPTVSDVAGSEICREKIYGHEEIGGRAVYAAPTICEGAARAAGSGHAPASSGDGDSPAADRTRVGSGDARGAGGGPATDFENETMANGAESSADAGDHVHSLFIKTEPEFQLMVTCGEDEGGGEAGGTARTYDGTSGGASSLPPTYACDNAAAGFEDSKNVHVAFPPDDVRGTGRIGDPPESVVGVVTAREDVLPGGCGTDVRGSAAACLACGSESTPADARGENPRCHVCGFACADAPPPRHAWRRGATTAAEARTGAVAVGTPGSLLTAWRRGTTTTTAAARAGAVAPGMPGLLLAARRRCGGGTSKTCGECARTFATRQRLMHHLEQHRMKPRRCRAEGCGAAFATLAEVKAHVSAQHPSERTHRCGYCQMAFRTSQTLKQHQRTHTGERPYECETCHAAFAQKSTLRSHVRTHTGEKPFACATCGLAFAQSGNLRMHQRIHKRQEREQVYGTV